MFQSAIFYGMITDRCSILEQNKMSAYLTRIKKQVYDIPAVLTCLYFSNLQLAELRQRLDHAEADRQELQDELRQEREARQKLEKMIKELKLQIQKSSKNGKGK